MDWLVGPVRAEPFSQQGAVCLRLWNEEPALTDYEFFQQADADPTPRPITLRLYPESDDRRPGSIWSRYNVIVNLSGFTGVFLHLRVGKDEAVFAYEDPARTQLELVSLNGQKIRKRKRRKKQPKKLRPQAKKTGRRRKRVSA
jgi:hypothetical protein